VVLGEGDENPNCDATMGESCIVALLVFMSVFCVLGHYVCRRAMLVDLFAGSTRVGARVRLGLENTAEHLR